MSDTHLNPPPTPKVMQIEQLKPIIEAALLASTQPMSVQQLGDLFSEAADVSREQIARALEALAGDCAGRGVELKEVASGFRYQVRQYVHAWISRMWTERPSRYSRALLETLARAERGRPRTLRVITRQHHHRRPLLRCQPSTPAASPSLPIATGSIRPVIDNVPTGRSISADMLPSPWRAGQRILRLCSELLKLQPVVAHEERQGLHVANRGTCLDMQAQPSQ